MKYLTKYVENVLLKKIHLSFLQWDIFVKNVLVIINIFITKNKKTKNAKKIRNLKNVQNATKLKKFNAMVLIIEVRIIMLVIVVNVDVNFVKTRKFLAKIV